MHPTAHLLNLHPIEWAAGHKLTVLGCIGLYLGAILLQKADRLQELSKIDLLSSLSMQARRHVKIYSFIGFFLVLGSLGLMIKSLL